MSSHRLRWWLEQLQDSCDLVSHPWFSSLWQGDYQPKALNKDRRNTCNLGSRLHCLPWAYHEAYLQKFPQQHCWAPRVGKHPNTAVTCVRQVSSFVALGDNRNWKVKKEEYIHDLLWRRRRLPWEVEASHCHAALILAPAKETNLGY